MPDCYNDKVSLLYGALGYCPRLDGRLLSDTKPKGVDSISKSFIVIIAVT